MMISMKSSIGYFLYGHHSRSYSSILPFLFTPSLPNISSSANSTSCLFVSAIVFKTRYYCRSHYLLANFPFHSCCFSSQITPDNHLHPLHPDWTLSTSCIFTVTPSSHSHTHFFFLSFLILQHTSTSPGSPPSDPYSHFQYTETPAWPYLSACPSPLHPKEKPTSFRYSGTP